MRGIVAEVGEDGGGIIRLRDGGMPVHFDRRSIQRADKSLVVGDEVVVEYHTTPLSERIATVVYPAST